MIWWHVVLVVIVSYFCGNVSFARMISKAKKDDITKLGSGNPGSTNILRNYDENKVIFRWTSWKIRN